MLIRNLQQSKSSLENEIQQKKVIRVLRFSEACIINVLMLGKEDIKMGFSSLKNKTRNKGKLTYVVGKRPGVKRITFGCRAQSKM